MSQLRRLAWAALVAGVAGGLLLAAMQAAWVTPAILEAEAYEVRGEPPAEGPAPRVELWSPAEGVQRVALTVLSDVLAAVGFALLLVAGMALRGAPVTVPVGVLWGAAGYAAFVLAPALGLPPDLPGAAAGPLAARQAWWVGTVAATAGGLALLAFAPRRYKAAGLVLLLAPHALGAPQATADAGGSGAPAALAAHFVAAVLVTNAAFWAVLGAVSAWVLGRKA